MRLKKPVNLLRIGCILLLVGSSVAFIPVLLNVLFFRAFLSYILGYSYNYTALFGLLYFIADYGIFFQVIAVIVNFSTILVLAIGMLGLAKSGNSEISSRGILGGIMLLLGISLDLVGFFISLNSAPTYYSLIYMLYSLIYGYGYGGGIGILTFLLLFSIVFYFVGFLIMGQSLKSMKKHTSLNRIGLITPFMYILVLILNIVPLMGVSASSMNGLLFIIYGGAIFQFISNLCIAIEAMVGLSRLRNNLPVRSTAEPTFTQDDVRYYQEKNAEINKTSLQPKYKEVCPNCGAPKLPNTKFCGICGSAFH